MIPKQRRAPDQPRPYTDETLAAAIAGDRDAFGEIYRAHHDEVLRFAYYRLTSRETAEEITSETFVRAMRHIRTFATVRGGMPAWLITIARNLISDHYKSARVRMEHFATDGEMRDAATEPGPDDYVLIRLEDQALHDAIGRLSDQQRQCVTLRFLQGLTVVETGAVMGKNEGAIKTLQYRAVRALARQTLTDRALAEAGPR